MVLKEGVMISTGFNAGAELELADNSMLKVYQLTMIKIDKFFKEKAKIKTDINLNIGKVRAHVQKIGEELSDFNVVTPTSVVSVRGTGMDIHESDRGTNVRGLEHVVEVRDTLGRREAVSPGQESDVKPGEAPTSVTMKMQDKSKADTTIAGLTKTEVQARYDADVPEVRLGEPEKTEVRQSDVPPPVVHPEENGC